MTYYFAKYEKEVSQTGERELPVPHYEKTGDYKYLATGKDYVFGQRVGVLQRSVLRVRVVDSDIIEVRALRPTSIFFSQTEPGNVEHFTQQEIQQGEVRRFERGAFHLVGNLENRIIWDMNPLLETQGD